MARVYRDPYKRNALGQPAWCIDYLDSQGVRRRERTDASTKELAQKILRKKLDEVELIKIHGLSAVQHVKFSDFLPEYLAPGKSDVGLRSRINAVFRMWSDVNHGSWKVSLSNDDVFEFRQEDLHLLERVSDVYRWTERQQFLNALLTGPNPR